MLKSWITVSLICGFVGRAREIDPETGEVVWQSPGFEKALVPVRDASLRNGSTLVTSFNKIVEVTT
jgi:hypothetical protein